MAGQEALLMKMNRDQLIDLCFRFAYLEPASVKKKSEWAEIVLRGTRRDPDVIRLM